MAVFGVSDEKISDTGGTAITRDNFPRLSFSQIFLSRGIWRIALQLWVAFLYRRADFIVFASRFRIAISFGAIISRANGEGGTIGRHLTDYFMAAAASAAISGVEVENCGCFGELYRSSLGVGFFVRNGVLLFLALFLIGLNETAPKNKLNKEGIELRHL